MGIPADNPPNAPMPLPISMMAPTENPSTRATSADRTIQMLTLGMASAPSHPRPREHRESDTPEPLEHAGRHQEPTRQDTRRYRLPRLSDDPSQEPEVEADIGQHGQHVVAPRLLGRGLGKHPVRD